MTLLPLTIREATAQECETIAALAAKTFTDSFGHLYTPENLASHLASHCSVAYFTAALAAGDTVLIAERNGELIGYAKVGHVVVPVKAPPRGAQEIHRVYIDTPHQGQGYGKALMIHILSLPRLTTARMVYLSVWEENLKAQGLYTQYGFKPVGHYVYHVGTQGDAEIIMARMG